MCNIYKYYILLILISFIIVPVKSQTYIDPELKSLFNKTDTINVDFKKPLKDAKNEVNIVISSGFLVYKTFVSSQDKPSCVFSPSCSEFAVEAFQKKGMFLGWLMTFDRLSRCHSFVNQKHYHFDNDKKLFNDPIK